MATLVAQDGPAATSGDIPFKLISLHEARNEGGNAVSGYSGSAGE